VATDDGLDVLYAALADPTRRWLVRRLLGAGPHTATELARDLPMSRQAVVHHLQALEDAGLVDGRRTGREVRWSATTRPLVAGVAWMLDTASGTY
jgi:DNA-binding transcriptional ArsR family regulator